MRPQVVEYLHLTRVNLIYFLWPKHLVHQIAAQLKLKFDDRENYLDVHTLNKVAIYALSESSSPLFGKFQRVLRTFPSSTHNATPEKEEMLFKARVHTKVNYLSVMQDLPFFAKQPTGTSKRVRSTQACIIYYREQLYGEVQESLRQAAIDRHEANARRERERRQPFVDLLKKELRFKHNKTKVTLYRNSLLKAYLLGEVTEQDYPELKHMLKEGTTKPVLKDDALDCVYTMISDLPIEDDSDFLTEMLGKIDFEEAYVPYDIFEKFEEIRIISNLSNPVDSLERATSRLQARNTLIDQVKRLDTGVLALEEATQAALAASFCA